MIKRMKLVNLNTTVMFQMFLYTHFEFWEKILINIINIHNSGLSDAL